MPTFHSARVGTTSTLVAGPDAPAPPDAARAGPATPSTQATRRCRRGERLSLPEPLTRLASAAR